MSGTSGDGVDASIINSDGQNAYNVLTNKYVKYSEELSGNIHKLKKLSELNIFSVKSTDLKKIKELPSIESLNFRIFQILEFLIVPCSSFVILFEFFE